MIESCGDFSHVLVGLNSAALIDSIKVIKANMEGAELNLVRDLDQNNMFNEFSFYCSYKDSFPCFLRTGFFLKF